MSYRTGVTAFALAALTLAPALAGAQATAPAKTPSAQKVDDSTLDSRIEKRLKADASLKADDIDVSVDNGVVTLTGTVHSRAQKDHAAQLAKVTGVTRVENKLEVETTGTSGVGAKADKTMDKAGDKADKAMDKASAKTDKAKDKAADKADKAKDKSDSKADKAADKSKDALSETGEAITDAWITTKVKTDFVGEDLLKGSDINVDTNNHVVTLKGTVASAAGRARAMEIAKATKGVNRVVDNLTIAPKK